MAMALDEPRVEDQVFDVSGFKYLVDTDFLEKAKPIKVDFQQFGFKITSSIELGGGCASGCGSKGCGA